MSTSFSLSALALPLVLLAAACRNDGARDGGTVQIAIEQSLTGQTTSAGRFTMRGSFTDDGTTTEELVFGGPLDQPTVPVTFRRTLTGREGTMVLRGPATLTFGANGQATLAGSWEVESATGRYVGAVGRGSLTGSANFAAAPPSASLAYEGTIER